MKIYQVDELDLGEHYKAPDEKIKSVVAKGLVKIQNSVDKMIHWGKLEGYMEEFFTIPQGVSERVVSQIRFENPHFI